jgi:light-regulated signal transduction histidine kinase (bacteriophytochrome)
VLVGGLTDMLRRTIGESVELDIDLEENLPPVAIDSNQLENALLNLAVNARDAMPGGGKLIVRTLSRGDQVLLTVSDTGIGMSEETQRRAFEPFFTTKRQGEGTGPRPRTGGRLHGPGGRLARRRVERRKWHDHPPFLSAAARGHRRRARRDARNRHL